MAALAIVYVALGFMADVGAAVEPCSFRSACDFPLATANCPMVPYPSCGRRSNSIARSNRM